MSQAQFEDSVSNRFLSYFQVPETNHQLDRVDLATLDLSTFDEPGGKQVLAAELKNAIEQVGKRCQKCPGSQF